MKVTHQGILDVLADGPLLGQDIAAFFPDSSARDVAAAVSSLRTAKRKRVYILRWTTDVMGEKHQPRPVYALGSRLDAPRPAPRPAAEATARYKRRNRVRAPNSVFQLARFV